MTVISGVVGLSIDGLGDYDTAETATVVFGGRVVGESLVGGNGKIGSTRKGVVSSIEVAVFIHENQRAEDMKGVKNRTITLKCDDRNYVMTGSDFIDAPNLDASKGSVNAKFEGVQVTEVS